MHIQESSPSSNNIKNNDYACDEDSDNESEVKLVGLTKISLYEIITVSDFVNKIIPLVSVYDKNFVLGHLNFDLSIENSGSEGLDLKNKKKSQTPISNFNAIYQENKKNNFDGKFFFNIKLINLVFDDSFLKLLNKYNPLNEDSNVPNNKKFFLMYKLGKNIKKISKILNFDDKSNYEKIFNKFFILALNFNEIIELNLQFSSKYIINKSKRINLTISSNS